MSSVPGPALGRREFALGAAAAAAAAALGRSAHAAEPTAPKSLRALSDECLRIGEECLSHCLASFRGGDTALAACAQEVYEMLPVCAALGRLASAESRHLAQLSQPTAAICDACEAECRKHAEMDVCKRCADACKALSAALRA